LLKILGIAKLLGGIAILYGRFPTLKEWAYAGYTFNLLGASASHAFSGDPLLKIMVPIVILAFVLVSYRQWKTGIPFIQRPRGNFTFLQAARRRRGSTLKKR